MAAFEAAARLSELDPAPGEAMVDGVNVAVTPECDVAVSATAALNPGFTAVVIPTDPDAPWWIVIDTAFVVSVNGGAMVTLTAAVLVTPPPTAVSVSANEPSAALDEAVTVSTEPPDPGAVSGVVA